VVENDSLECQKGMQLSNSWKEQQKAPKPSSGNQEDGKSRSYNR